MSEHGFFLPHWTRKHILSDEEYADAYSQTPSEKRALLKSLTAFLYRQYPPKHVEETRKSTCDPFGLAVETSITSPDVALVIINSSVKAPAQFLASLIPVLTSGAKETVVIRTGEERWPSPLLTAMELAGQETALCLSPEETDRLVSELSNNRVKLGLSCLGYVPSCQIQQQSCPVHLAPAQCSIGVYADQATSYDYDALEWMHRGNNITAWNVEQQHHDFSRREGDVKDFAVETYDAALIPAGLKDKLPPYFPLVLTPGNEGIWVWPDLSDDHFVVRNIAFSRKVLS